MRLITTSWSCVWLEDSLGDTVYKHQNWHVLLEMLSDCCCLYFSLYISILSLLIAQSWSKLDLSVIYSTRHFPQQELQCKPLQSWQVTILRLLIKTKLNLKKLQHKRTSNKMFSLDITAILLIHLTSDLTAYSSTTEHKWLMRKPKMSVIHRDISKKGLKGSDVVGEPAQSWAILGWQWAAADSVTHFYLWRTAHDRAEETELHHAPDIEQIQPEKANLG